MKNKYIVLQEEISDCGVCCLQSIVKYYDGFIPLETLRYETSTSSTGVTAIKLIECAEKYGFQTKAYKDKDLFEIKVPFIAHLNINKSLTHFVVIYKIDKKNVTIMDPSKGIVRQSIEEFLINYDGITIELIPLKKLPNIKNKRIIDKKIYKILKTHKLKMISIIMLSIIFTTLSIIGSTYTSFIDDNTNIKIVLFIIINIVTLIIKYIIDLLTLKLQDNLDIELSKYIYNYILELPLEYIQLKGTGEIVKRIEESELIKRIKIDNYIKIITKVIFLIPTIIILSITNIFLPILLTIFILINLIINKNYYKTINKDIDNEVYFETNYNNLLIDTFKGITSIHHTNSKDYFKENLLSSKKIKNKSSYILSKKILRYGIINNILLITLEILINTNLYINIKNNSISIESFFIVNILFGLLLNSLLEIMSIIPSIKYKRRLTNKIDELINLKIQESAEQKVSHSSIIFNNVEFSYIKGKKIIQNINLKIKKGGKFLIKGENGKGKSTIFKLLTKELTGYKGSIKINNIELSNIKKEYINDKISYLSQQEHLFIGTIRENILLGKDIPETKLNKIISICCLNKVIDKLPFKLDTFLIGGGEELSGGERQLIILARHLIQNKDILIIDEGTSEISNTLEDKVLKNIIRYYKDKTIIFVSHKNKDYLFKDTIKLN